MSYCNEIQLPSRVPIIILDLYIYRLEDIENSVRETTESVGEIDQKFGQQIEAVKNRLDTLQFLVQIIIHTKYTYNDLVVLI